MDEYFENWIYEVKIRDCNWVNEINLVYGDILCRDLKKCF